jgi:hypothetical protein
MNSTIGLRFAVLALGTAFLAVPALAQDEQPPGPAPNQGEMSGAPPPGGEYGAPRAQRPYYNYAPGQPAPAGGAVAACEERFHSYDPATGMYRGYDGALHHCP